jgi:hypothetical protein
VTLAEFKATLGEDTAPAVGQALVALWHDTKRDRDRAQEIA